MTETEKLRALLAEARDSVKASLAEDGITEARRDYRRGLHDRIDAALTKPVAPASLNHPAFCSIYDDGRCTCGFASRQAAPERTPLAEPVEAGRDCICTGPWTTGHRHTDICREFRALKSECERQMEYGIKQHEAAQDALRERDGARAEVEVLRGVGCQTADKEGEEPSGPCGACVKCAYQRGAEAMREAAIRACAEPQMGTEADAIRALPVPEDK